MAKLIKLALFVGVVYVGMKMFGFGYSSGEEMQGLQARAEVDGKDKIVVLLTGTSWCPACKELDREVIQKSDWDAFIGSEAVFAKYQYGAFNRPKSGPKGEMLERFDIEGFPTMVVLNRDGEVLDEMAGYHSGGLSYYKEWIGSL